MAWFKKDEGNSGNNNYQKGNNYPKKEINTSYKMYNVYSMDGKSGFSASVWNSKLVMEFFKEGVKNITAGAPAPTNTGGRSKNVIMIDPDNVMGMASYIEQIVNFRTSAFVNKQQYPPVSPFTLNNFIMTKEGEKHANGSIVINTVDDPTNGNRVAIKYSKGDEEIVVVLGSNIVHDVFPNIESIEIIDACDVKLLSFSKFLSSFNIFSLQLYASTNHIIKTMYKIMGKNNGGNAAIGDDTPPAPARVASESTEAALF